MKKALLQPLIRLFFQVLLLLVCYFISRSIFTLINLEKFDGLTIPEFFRLSFFALRYDLSAIVSINGLYFTLLLLPLPIWRFPVWDKFLQWLFVVTNAIAFAFEISDWAYFPFILKRSTIDVLDMISRKGDFLSLLPHFLVTYWYAPLGFALLVFGFCNGANSSGPSCDGSKPGMPTYLMRPPRMIAFVPSGAPPKCVD